MLDLNLDPPTHSVLLTVSGEGKMGKDTSLYKLFPERMFKYEGV